MCVGLFGRRRPTAPRSRSGRRRGADLRRRRAALARGSCARSRRVVGRPIERATRHHRPARAREHRAPARPHGGDRGGADDRRRARVFASVFAAGAKATINGAIDDEPRGRDRRPEHRRLLAVLARGAAHRRSRAGRRQRQRRSASSQAKVQGVSGNQSVIGDRPARRFPALYKLDMKQGGDAALRGLGPATQVDRREGLRRRARRQGRRHAARHDADRQAPALRVSGIVEDKGGLLGDLDGDQRGRADAVRRAQGRLRPRRARPGADEKAVKDADRRRPRSSAIPRPRC